MTDPLLTLRIDTAHDMVHAVFVILVVAYLVVGFFLRRMRKKLDALITENRRRQDFIIAWLISELNKSLNEANRIVFTHPGRSAEVLQRANGLVNAFRAGRIVVHDNKGRLEIEVLL